MRGGVVAKRRKVVASAQRKTHDFTYEYEVNETNEKITTTVTIPGPAWDTVFKKVVQVISRHPDGGTYLLLEGNLKRSQEHIRGLTEEEALIRIRAQEKRRGIGNSGGDDCDDGGISDNLLNEVENGVVTAVITNDGTLEDLEKSLEKALYDPTSFKR